jgi:hypothetical protein
MRQNQRERQTYMSEHTHVAPEPCPECGGLATVADDGARHWWHAPGCPAADRVARAVELGARLREQHPDWSPDRVRVEVFRRLGDAAP